MKKIATILFIALLCAALSFCCIAAEDHSHGEAIFEHILNDEETAFCTVYEDGCVVVEGEGMADFYNLDQFIWMEGYFIDLKYFYIGEGITDLFNVPSGMKFIIDENNPYLSSDENGAVYNKDKTELVIYRGDDKLYTVADSVKVIRSHAFSDCYIRELIIPDTVEVIEPCAFWDCRTVYLELPDTLKVIPEGCFNQFSTEALVLPSSVEKIEEYAFWNIYENMVLFVMNDQCEIAELDKNVILAAYSGSTAEEYAVENGLVFASLDENHKHIYLPRITKLSTCTEDGIITYDCPCGNATPYESVEETYGHYMDYDSPAPDGNVYCEYCGEMADCNCICHRAEKEDASAIERFFYKIYVFFWKLFSISETCKCGNNYHY